MSLEEEIAALKAAMSVDRPEWQKKALCRGLGEAFYGRAAVVGRNGRVYRRALKVTTQEQVDVCNGTTAPWAKPCPVKKECLNFFFDLAVESMQMAYDNKLVFGGELPIDLLVLSREEKVRRKGVQADGPVVDCSHTAATPPERTE